MFEQVKKSVICKTGSAMKGLRHALIESQKRLVMQRKIKPTFFWRGGVGWWTLLAEWQPLGSAWRLV
jgi:hypothetical protein